MELGERYQILREIKSPSGKYGRLFQALDKRSSEQVLLKVVPSHSEQAAELLRNESLFSFSIEGLPRIIELAEDAQQVLLIRNYTEGITLAEYWTQISRKRRLSFMIELLGGLQPLLSHLEERRIVHADLRPSNILISPAASPSASLIDFGLGIDQRHSRSKKLFFPLGYAAPELVLNQLDLSDTRTDIYALGISFWRLFTGKLPLSHPNPSIFTNLQLTHPLPDDSALPKGLYSILKKMTAKHQFKQSPNRMEVNEMRHCLREGMLERYNKLEEVLVDLNELVNRKSFYQRISLR